MLPLARRRASPQLLCGWALPLLLLVSPVIDVRGQEDIASLTPEQLGQLVAYNLENEERRPNETLFRFSEFQDVSEMDCASRLLYLLNITATLRDQLDAYNNDILGISGLYMQLLQKVPDENTWIWLLTSAHERVVNKVDAFWARIAALSLDRHNCMMPPVRDPLLAGAVEWKRLHADFTELQWKAFAFGKLGSAPKGEDNLLAANVWIGTVREWFDTLLTMLFAGLQEIQANNMLGGGEATLRLHHQDEQGYFVTYEFLRRKAFGQWATDRGLLRAMLRHIWKPLGGKAEPISMGDFGAGGGHYSTWLNETGLVQAFAFDGTKGAAELTNGAVQEVNLVTELHLWRTFDWVLCLEVGEHVPAQFSSTLMANLKRHATKGIVMSWSDDWEGIGHVNCKSHAEFVKFVEAETGFVLDTAATAAVKASCEIDYIARTVAVFRAPEAATSSKPAAAQPAREEPKPAEAATASAPKPAEGKEGESGWGGWFR